MTSDQRGRNPECQPKQKQHSRDHAPSPKRQSTPTKPENKSSNTTNSCDEGKVELELELHASSDSTEASISESEHSSPIKCHKLATPDSDTVTDFMREHKMRSVVHKVDKQKRVFPCKICKKEMHSLHSVHGHIREVHRDAPWAYICNFCPKTYSRNTSRPS